MSLTERRQRNTSEPFAPLSPGAERHRAERRERRLRKGRRRLDVAIGLLIALTAIIVASGLGVVAIGAVIVLLVCALSFAFERLRRPLRRRRGDRR
jgi:Flp pilus assembly protein TadB